MKLTKYVFSFDKSGRTNGAANGRIYDQVLKFAE